MNGKSFPMRKMTIQFSKWATSAAAIPLPSTMPVNGVAKSCRLTPVSSTHRGNVTSVFTVLPAVHEKQLLSVLMAASWSATSVGLASLLSRPSLRYVSARSITVSAIANENSEA